MADEVVKVIKIEAQGSETTVKQLRQEISSLRDALLNTEKGSDQYKETVEKLTNTQNKLSEVMKAGKEVFVGSKQELKALKQQMDQLQEGTAEYNAAFQRAAEITHTLQERQELLKYSAADVGTQLGNMVSIGSSLAAGFNSINAVMALTGSKSEDLQKVMVKLQAGIALVQGLQGLEGMTKRMSGLVNGLTEMIFKTTETTAAVTTETAAVKANAAAQEANTVATAGATVATNAFKKALVATGIGAIVVLIGTLVAHWEDLKDMIGLSDEKLQAFNDTMDKVKTVIGGVGNAIFKFFIAPIKSAIIAVSTLAQATKEVFSGNFREAGRIAREGMSKIVDTYKEGFSVITNYQEGAAKTAAKIQEKRTLEAMKASAEELEDYIKDMEAKEGADWKYTEAGKKMYDEYFQKKLAGYKKDSKEYREAQREMWAYNREYNKKIEDAGKETVKNTKAKAKEVTDNSIKEKEREEAEIAKIQRRAELALMDAKDAELAELKDKYDQEVALYEKHQKDITNLTAEYEAKKAKIEADAKANEEQEKEKKIAEATKKALKMSDRRLQTSDDANAQAVQTIELEYSLKEAKSSASLSFNDLIEETNRIYEANKQHLLEQAAEYKSLMDNNKIDKEARENAERDYNNTMAELRNLDTQNLIDNLNIQRKAVEQQIDRYSDLANSIISIFGSVADMMEDEIKREIEAGDISEEEGKRRFEAVKRLQIAQATIQMLAGIATALAGAFTTKTGPWDMVLAGAQAATIAATGIAQIVKIKNTQLGGSSSVSSAAVAAPVQTSPEEYVPQYTQNATGESEITRLADSIHNQKVYVVESDITEAQNRNKVRVTESTW